MIFPVGNDGVFRSCTLLDRVSAESRQPGGMQHNITDIADRVMHYSGWGKKMLPDMLDVLLLLFKIQVPGLVGFWEKIHL